MFLTLSVANLTRADWPYLFGRELGAFKNFQQSKIIATLNVLILARFRSMHSETATKNNSADKNLAESYFAEKKRLHKQK